MNICVFALQVMPSPEAILREADKLGKLIGCGGHSLVNGGANVGLMEALTVSARAAGAKTVGIIPERMIGRSLASENLHDVIITKDMKDRKGRMREMSDAFIALPGGFGTLEEILEVITLRQLSCHTKPIVFINTNNFFQHLLKQFELTYKEQFAKDLYRSLYFVANNPEEAIEYIKNYIPVELDAKWFKVPQK